MKISAIVPTWRRPADLDRCLHAFADQERYPDELLVIARREDEDAHRVLRPYMEGSLPIRIVYVEVPGQVAALNAGLGAAEGEIVAITDDDAAPRRDWLSRVEEHFERDPSVGAVGGRDHVPGAPEPERADGVPVGRVRLFRGPLGNHHLGAGPPREVDLIKGVNMSYRSEAIRDAWFDERLHGSGSQIHNDMAFSLAVRRRGWKVLYDPAVAVDHFESERFDGNDRRRPLASRKTEVVHNEAFVLLDWLPLWRRWPTWFYFLIVGTRGDPGPVLALERMAVARDWDALNRMRASTRGRLLALATYRRSRKKN